jgi:exodeoxyribonuclease VII large subunit
MEDSRSLSSLILSVKNSLEERFPLPVWLVAEISEMNINRSGHCYLELIEKDILSDKIIAKARATIWAFAFRMIRPYFETSTGETLRSGLKVLLKVSVEFHEVYGFSLNVSDIDPQYTLGDLAMKRTRIIQQLQDDGVFEMNKLLAFPKVPQRIAVVSSETAAGYGDFQQQLQANTHNFAFKTRLFPAVMQGNNAPESIITAFERVYESIADFDVVVLLRGGGSKSDLSCFDDYELSYYITQFPLPVLTGIGHERDDSVCDLVAHTRLKTPTAVAEFLIQRLLDFKQQLDYYFDSVVNHFDEQMEKHKQQLSNSLQQLNHISREQISWNQQKLLVIQSGVQNAAKQYFHDKNILVRHLSSDFKRLAKNGLTHESDNFVRHSIRLKKWLNNYFHSKTEHLHFLEEKNHWANPQHQFDRGFSLIKQAGKIISDPSLIKSGEPIELQMAKGSVSGLFEPNELSENK